MARIASKIVPALTGVTALVLGASPAGAAATPPDGGWHVNDQLLSTIKTTWTWGAVVLTSIAVINRVVRAQRRRSYAAAHSARTQHNPLARRFT